MRLAFFMSSTPGLEFLLHSVCICSVGMRVNVVCLVGYCTVTCLLIIMKRQSVYREEHIYCIYCDEEEVEFKRNKMVLFIFLTKERGKARTLIRYSFYIE